jgi:mycothiol synthase
METLRPLTVADAPAVADLLAAAEEVDRTGANYDADDLREEYADPAVDLARDSLAAVAPGGRIDGYALVRGTAQAIGTHRIFLDGRVRPSARGTGIGTRLLDWAAARAAAKHAALHPDLPGMLDVEVAATVPDAAALAGAAGFTPVRWWYEMRRPLASLPPVPSAPSGLRLVPYEASWDDEVRRAHAVAFAQHWGSTPPDPERWAQWFTGSRAFRPSLSRIVLDDSGAVAAYLLAYCYEADTAATGVREAYVGQLGTLPAFRAQGLGTLLLATALGAASAEGYERVALTVDSGNATGALGLYQRLGFAVDHELTTWEKPVDEAGAPRR